MKTTIKLKQGMALVVEPVTGGIKVDLTMFGTRLGGDTLTLDQAGVLLFAVEQAAEAAGVKAQSAQGGA